MAKALETREKAMATLAALTAPIMVKWILVIAIFYVLPSEPEGHWTYNRIEKNLRSQEECIKRAEEELLIIKAWSHHRVMTIRDAKMQCFWYEEDR